MWIYINNREWCGYKYIIESGVDIYKYIIESGVDI